MLATQLFEIRVVCYKDILRPLYTLLWDHIRPRVPVYLLSDTILSGTHGELLSDSWVSSNTYSVQISSYRVHAAKCKQACAYITDKTQSRSFHKVTEWFQAFHEFRQVLVGHFAKWLKWSGTLWNCLRVPPRCFVKRPLHSRGTPCGAKVWRITFEAFAGLWYGGTNKDVPVDKIPGKGGLSYGQICNRQSSQVCFLCICVPIAQGSFAWVYILASTLWSSMSKLSWIAQLQDDPQLHHPEILDFDHWRVAYLSHIFQNDISCPEKPLVIKLVE